MRLSPNSSEARERRNRRVALAIVAALVLTIAAPALALLLG
ncbi:MULTISPECIES: hypothetical protein [Sanguibacter]|jgi:hypothetical protein|nr:MULTISPECIES: hypothetical protein [Sanguibacter]